MAAGSGVGAGAGKIRLSRWEPERETAGRHWRRHRDALVVLAYRQGASIRLIAYALDISPARVAAIVSGEGLGRDRRGARKQVTEIFSPGVAAKRLAAKRRSQK